VHDPKVKNKSIFYLNTLLSSLVSVSRNGAINYSPQPYFQYVNTGSASVSDKHLKICLNNICNNDWNVKKICLNNFRNNDWNVKKYV